MKPYGLDKWLPWPVLSLSLLVLVAGCGRQQGADRSSADTPNRPSAAAGESGSADSPGSDAAHPDGESTDVLDPGQPSPEAVERKARSTDQLRRRGVLISEDLPVIATLASSGRRESAEVACRAMALCVVGLKGEGREQAVVQRLVRQYGIEDSLTPDERKFVSETAPAREDQVRFAWRHESYWVLLWALGLVDELGPADTMCDVGQAASVLQTLGREEFLRAAELRPQAELLDAADLAFRAREAVVAARRANRPAPSVLDAGVVLERQRALQWLIDPRQREWDEIALER